MPESASESNLELAWSERFDLSYWAKSQLSLSSQLNEKKRTREILHFWMVNIVWALGNPEHKDMRNQPEGGDECPPRISRSNGPGPSTFSIPFVAKHESLLVNNNFKSMPQNLVLDLFEWTQALSLNGHSWMDVVAPKMPSHGRACVAAKSRFHCLHPGSLQIMYEPEYSKACMLKDASERVRKLSGQYNSVFNTGAATNSHFLRFIIKFHSNRIGYPKARRKLANNNRKHSSRRELAFTGDIALPEECIDRDKPVSLT
ncbi:hypothetical protein B0H13DRAFT_1872251 [Mycena leptocephala]|nr:hypothetical protein B0H13DRAFT_1872249 [Mycena leptocephala]KAJ7915294.1 hypothetical protein B0H13DRAFT_1872251 [Mycena leptocephala]